MKTNTTEPNVPANTACTCQNCSCHCDPVCTCATACSCGMAGCDCAKGGA